VQGFSRSCTILGCYVIVCSGAGNVLNFFVADIGLPSWMARVEELKKNSLDQLIANANRFMLESRIHWGCVSAPE
jgi:hypothetical protein